MDRAPGSPGPTGSAVKGLDTPILLGLLEGDRATQGLLAELEGEELCTTVLNLFELGVVAKTGPRIGRDQRARTLERLRSRLTVLEIDPRAAELASGYSSRATSKGVSSPTWLILGALESHGCQTWFTTREARFPESSKKVHVTIIEHSTPKTRIVRKSATA